MTSPPQVDGEPTALADLLARVEAATGPDPRLDGALDALVDHENEAWPPPYTSDVTYLQQVARRRGLDKREVANVALEAMNADPRRPVCLIYAAALLQSLIAKESGQ